MNFFIFNNNWNNEQWLSVTDRESIFMEKEKYKLFISYSWDSNEHQKWAKNLADKLEEFDEIHVVFDQYDLDSFEDKN